MRILLISTVFFLGVSCFGVSMEVSEAHADEIELLERKLEYLKAKQQLDLELDIVTAKIEKLNSEYSDIIESAASPSTTAESAPTTVEFLLLIGPLPVVGHRNPLIQPEMSPAAESPEGPGRKGYQATSWSSLRICYYFALDERPGHRMRVLGMCELQLQG